MEEINLKDFWDYYKKYIFYVIIISVVLGLGMFYYSSLMKKPLYSTYTTIILVRENNNNSTSSDINQDIMINQKLVSTYSEIVKSRLVLDQVIKSLDLPYTYEELASKVSVSSVEDTEILKIVVKDENSREAVIIANEISSVFSNEVSKIYKLDNVSVIDMAKLNENPVNIHTARDTVIACLLGIVISSSIIFVIYYFDDTLRDVDTLEEELKLPILSKVCKSLDFSTLIVNDKPNSLTSESIRNLRANLQFSSVDEKLKTVLITSSIPGDGKSFVSANLAISFAQAGKKVLIIDCDLRKGVLHKSFGVNGRYGLSNLLIEDVENYDNYLFKTSIKNLSIIPRGTYPPNPSELLSSKKNADLLDLLKNKYDIIILDSAPITGLSDSLVLSTIVDEVVLVTSVNHTPKTVLLNAKKTLEGIGAKIAGVVANKVPAKKGGYGGYYYYDDSQDTKDKKGKSK